MAACGSRSTPGAGVDAGSGGSGSGGATSSTGGSSGTGGLAGSGGSPGASGGSGSGGVSGTGGLAGGTGGGPAAGSDGGVPDAGGTDAGGRGGGNGGAAGGTSGGAATTFVYVSGTGSSIIRGYRMTATGMLEPAAMTSDGGSNPTYLAFHPNKKFLYAVNESGNTSKLLAFAIDATGALTKLASNGEAATTPGQGPPHLSVHPGGKWVFAAHYGSGHTTVHPILTNGGLGALAFSDKTATSEAHQAKVDPTGKFLLVPCRTPNTVAQYLIDETSGALTANTPARVTAPTSGTGPRHMDFHPNGRWAYVLGELNGHVLSYAYDGTTGRLSDPQEVATKDGETSAAHLLVHPNGKFAFVSLRKNNELATLTLDAQSGRPTVSAHQTTMISTPRDFTIDPSGQFLLVANEGSGNVVVFAINAESGALTMRSVTTSEGIKKPQFVGALTLP